MRWKSQPQQARERVRERGLADAGDVLDQQVAAREDAGHREADLAFLAEDDLAGAGDDRFGGAGGSRLRESSSMQKGNRVSGLRVHQR